MRRPRRVPHGALGHQRIRDRGDLTEAELDAEDEIEATYADSVRRINQRREETIAFQPRGRRVLADESIKDSEKPAEVRRRFRHWTGGTE